MEYTTLGGTGLEVSRLCLGCMSFGSSEWSEWVLEDEESKELIEHAIDRGINFFDTANAYSHGESERILGEALSGYDRDRMVVATKVFFPMGQENRNLSGLSRKSIDHNLEASRDRLQLDTIDLYQTHRWDYDTPIEQTLSALDDAVRRGDIRHFGASSMWATQFADALATSDRRGLDRFATMQDHYNLVYREEEREMHPLCEREGIGVMPWSPLARGYLARPWEDLRTTTRSESDHRLTTRIDAYRDGNGDTINERVEELAADKGVSMAQIGIAWLLHKDIVDAPIIGTTSKEHLDDAIEALDISLSTSDMEYLEDPYEPVAVTGHE